MKTRISVLILLLSAAMLTLVSCESTQNTEQNIKLVTVKFGMLPYGDHTQAIIAEKNGWFNEVGIDFQYKLIKVEATIPALNNKELDVASSNANILLSSYSAAENLCMFAFADVFQGYAIMAQSSGNYKSYDEFVKSGLSPAEAIKSTVQQLKGKTFAYPSETAIKPFIDIVLEKGAISKGDYKSIVQDDPLNVNAMRAHKTDFQVGGVPSRITLQKEGFKPLISSIDIVKAATPSPESPELASVFHDGWAMRKDYYKDNRETVLRLVSVNFRINDYIRNKMDSALLLHMPYLSQVTGEQFTAEDGKIIYGYLDPFFTFNEQKSWFNNPQDPLYYQNLYGSIIKNFVKQGIYKTGKAPQAEDVIFADDIYKEMDKLKEQAEANFTKLSGMAEAIEKKKLTEKLNKAKKHFSIFNYYDAQKLTNEIISAL